MSKFAPRQFPCNIGLAPTADQGPRYIPITLPFTSSNLTFSDDLVLENENGAIANIQSLYIDNSTDATFSITLLESGMNITLANHTQGWFAILCHQQVSYQAIAFNGTNYGNVKLFFVNVPCET
jgi:hypothetical protein